MSYTLDMEITGSTVANLPSLTVRRLDSTDGAHIRWTRNSKKWFGNATAGQGLSDDQLRALFQERGFGEVTIEHGEYVKCSRCDGKGFFCGGPCFKCYGNEAKSWRRSS